MKIIVPDLLYDDEARSLRKGDRSSSNLNHIYWSEDVEPLGFKNTK